MLRVPDHQVAGHKAIDGKLGPLIDDSGHFYKPLFDDIRGSKELGFYTSVYKNTKIPDHIHRFFAVFHGTQLIQASDGSGPRPHLVLQNLVYDHLNPSIIDIKIGSRTWYPQVSKAYFQKCLKKDVESTSLSLGFRISGLQIYGNKDSGYWRPEKNLVKAFTSEDVGLILRKFVSSNLPADSNSVLDCSFAPVIFGGSTGILAQLLELKTWFENQTIYQFNSCSILMVYDKESLLEGRLPCSEIKLIDFAHAAEGRGVIDHNFLGGLCSLIKFVSEILTNPDEHSSKASPRDSEKICACTDNGTSESTSTAHC